MPLLRCDRCGLTLYGPPNGIARGDRCSTPVPAEWNAWKGILMTECFGTFEPVGTLSLEKTA